MAAQTSRSRTDTLATGIGGIAGMAAMPTNLMVDLAAVRSADGVQGSEAETVEAPSLETMLKAKYPNIHYHVFDASSGGDIAYSKSGSDDEESWWDLRMARHAEFMKLIAEKQIQRQMQASDLLSAAAAKSQLAAILSGVKLQAIFGDEIAGVPTETVLAITQAQVWGGGAVL